MLRVPRRAALLATLAAVTLTAAACDDDGPTGPPAESLACNTTVGNLAFGDTVTGVLVRESCRLTDGSYADRWRLEVDTASVLTIDHISNDFDPFLIIRDAQGNQIVSDDDGGIGDDSRITFGFAAGTYYVLANTFDADDFGGYTLIVR